jgi:NADH-quinone oxidoreductase subunit L
MSQIGYMFVAAGLGAYSAGMFHLMTHAFFKALLFMAAGLVIHALANEQDIRKMGGLGRELPWTTRAFLVGTLALMGIPPLAGFFSKDEIIANTLDGGALGIVLFVMAVIGAFLTALYAARLFFIVFRGPKSEFASTHLHHANHEGPLSMMWPVGVLAVLSIVGGWIEVPGGWKGVENWLDPVVQPLLHPEGWMEVVSSVVSVSAALLGILLAGRIWGRKSDLAERVRSRLPRATRALEHKLYFDEAYDAVFFAPSSRLARFLDRRVEQPVILDSAGQVAGDVRDTAGRVAATQSGLLRLYALLILGGLAVLLLVFLVVK